MTSRRVACSRPLSSTKYLIRRYHTWYVRVQIPKKLWRASKGKREFVKSLETKDLAEANSRKHAYIAEYKRQIKALERYGGSKYPESLPM